MPLGGAELRAVAGLFSASPLAVAPRGFGPTGRGAVGPVADLLRRCHRAGVTVFDLVGSPDRGFAKVCLAQAFPTPEDTLVLLVPPPGVGPSTTRAGSPPAPLPGEPPDAADASLAGFHRIVEGRFDPRARQTFDTFVASLVLHREAPDVLDVCVRCSTREELERAAHHPGSPLLSADLSLLEPTLLGTPPAADEGEDPRCLVRNVFSDGKLDGSAWGSDGYPSGPPLGPPRSVRDLEAGFRDVLELSFLTERGDRTLAQAALSFAVSAPWVLGAALLLPSPARLEEILGFRDVPKLSDSELERVRTHSGRRRAGPGRPAGA